MTLTPELGGCPREVSGRGSHRLRFNSPLEGRVSKGALSDGRGREKRGSRREGDKGECEGGREEGREGERKGEEGYFGSTGSSS